MLLAICGSWNVIVDKGSQVDSRWSAFVNVGRQASYICGSWIELKTWKGRSRETKSYYPSYQKNTNTVYVGFNQNNEEITY